MGFNAGKTIINHPICDDVYHLFMVKLGMVYYCFTNIIGVHWDYSSRSNGIWWYMVIIYTYIYIYIYIYTWFNGDFSNAEMMD